MVGKFLALPGKSYAYMEMAPSRSDIKDVQLIPAFRAISRRWRCGWPSTVAAAGARCCASTAWPVAASSRCLPPRWPRSRVNKRLAVQVNYVKKGKTTELELVPQPAVGFSEATYGELPAEDVIPILLPWQDKKTRYVWKSGKFTKP